MSRGPSDADRGLKRLGWQPRQHEPVWERVRLNAVSGTTYHEALVIGPQHLGQGPLDVYEVELLRLGSRSRRWVPVEHVWPRSDG